jgi:hypothetical protein
MRKKYASDIHNGVWKQYFGALHLLTDDKQFSSIIPVLCTSSKSKTPVSESMCELSFSKIEQSCSAA